MLLPVALLPGGLKTGTAIMNAQEVAHTNFTGHSLVGSWLLDTAPDDPENGVTLAIFTSDGTYVYTDQDGRTGIGSWESTSDTTGRLNFRLVSAEGIAIIRVNVETSPAGDTLTAEYTIESTDRAGQSTGEFGPVRAEGRRMRVEPMGEPGGTLEDPFDGSEEPEATPAT